MFGELYGLHTLRQILDANGIKSNRWSKIYKGLTVKEIESGISKVLQGVLRDKVVELAQKSDSTWSRSDVTIVFDDSIFKQWLKDEEIGKYFAKYFSGQTKSTVYGFRVTLIGLSLGDTFYPYHMRLTSKTDNTTAVACEMLEDMHEFLWRIGQEKNVEFPNLFVSADNGFDSAELLEKCDKLSEKLPIIPICVPKRTNKMEVLGQTMSISQAIDEGFIELEKKATGDKDKNEEPYILRLRVILSKYGREVTMLFFRLNGSSKVSVIYTTDLNIKAKTLRRRWFQRTLIEQFFRLLKDTLKIQQAKCTEKVGF